MNKSVSPENLVRMKLNILSDLYPSLGALEIPQNGIPRATIMEARQPKTASCIHGDHHSGEF